MDNVKISELIINSYHEFFKTHKKRVNTSLINKFVSEIYVLNSTQQDILKYFIMYSACSTNKFNGRCPDVSSFNITDNPIYDYLNGIFVGNGNDFEIPSTASSRASSRPSTALSEKGGFYKQRVIKVIRKY